MLLAVSMPLLRCSGNDDKRNRHRTRLIPNSRRRTKMSTVGRHLRARARPHFRRPKGNPPGSPSRQMLVDLRDAIQKEIDRGATKIRPSPQSSFLNANSFRGTNLKEKSPRGARTGKSWARLSEINRLPHERLNWKECQEMSRPND